MNLSDVEAEVLRDEPLVESERFAVLDSMTR